MKSIPATTISLVTALAASFFLSACGATDPSTEDTFDPDSKADSQVSTPLIPFYDPGTGKPATIGGLAVKTFAPTTDMNKWVSSLSIDGVGGCVWAAALEASPTELAPILADKTKRTAFFLAMVNSDATLETPLVTDITVSSLARSKLFADVYAYHADLSLVDWPAASRTSYKAALRIVVRAMLSVSKARASSVTITPDWTDQAWMSVDAEKGVIKYLVEYGDC
jgi:hypothetical protein